MIACSGSVGFDTIRTPFRTVERTLGGAAAYFAYSASFFDGVSIATAVGNDFPDSFREILAAKGVDLTGVQTLAGESFFFDCSFGFDLSVRKANETRLGVLEGLEPRVPPSLASRECVAYLATAPPASQLSFLRQLPNNRLSIIDTIEFFIQPNREAVLDAFRKVDGVVLNDAEARMAGGTPNLLKAGFSLLQLGSKFVVVKKGENGCILFYAGRAYPFPAFPLEDVVDPSGAGDAFAGGLAGWLSKKGVSRSSLSVRVLREAVAYGSVLGSFIVEDFGLARLQRLEWQDVEARLEEFKELTRL